MTQSRILDVIDGAVSAFVAKNGMYPDVPKRPRSPFINHNVRRITDVKANLDWTEEQIRLEKAGAALERKEAAE